MSAASGHREIAHTADVAFTCWAQALGPLFEEATLALGELCYERRLVREAESRRLRVEGTGREELLVGWLQEVYLLVELEGWLCARATGVRVGEDVATGELLGEPIDTDRHTLHTEIKAITYHGLAVECCDDGLWQATVVVDV